MPSVDFVDDLCNLFIGDYGRYRQRQLFPVDFLCDRKAHSVPLRITFLQMGRDRVVYECLHAVVCQILL